MVGEAVVAVHDGRGAAPARGARVAFQALQVGEDAAGVVAVGLAAPGDVVQAGVAADEVGAGGGCGGGGRRVDPEVRTEGAADRVDEGGGRQRVRGQRSQPVAVGVRFRGRAEVHAGRFGGVRHLLDAEGAERLGQDREGRGGKGDQVDPADPGQGPVRGGCLGQAVAAAEDRPVEGPDGVGRVGGEDRPVDGAVRLPSEFQGLALGAAAQPLPAHGEALAAGGGSRLAAPGADQYRTGGQLDVGGRAEVRVRVGAAEAERVGGAEGHDTGAGRAAGAGSSRWRRASSSCSAARASSRGSRRAPGMGRVPSS